MPIVFRSCQRCRGDVYASSDMFGAYLECLQCGWIKDISNDALSQGLDSAVRQQDTGGADVPFSSAENRQKRDRGGGRTPTYHRRAA